MLQDERGEQGSQICENAIMLVNATPDSGRLREEKVGSGEQPRIGAESAYSRTKRPFLAPNCGYRGPFCCPVNGPGGGTEEESSEY